MWLSRGSFGFKVFITQTTVWLSEWQQTVQSCQLTSHVEQASSIGISSFFHCKAGILPLVEISPKWAETIESSKELITPYTRYFAPDLYIWIMYWFLCFLAMRHHSSRQENSITSRYLPGCRDLCSLGVAAYTGVWLPVDCSAAARRFIPDGLLCWHGAWDRLRIQALFASPPFYLASHVAIVGVVEVCLVVGVIPWPSNWSRCPALSNKVQGFPLFFLAIHSTKQIVCFNHRVVPLVADKLKRQWLYIFYFANCIRQSEGKLSRPTTWSWR